MSSVAETVRGEDALIQRRACAACGASELSSLLAIDDVPVHMGVTAQAPSEDVVLPQLWVTCGRCGCVQLAALAPLELVYQSQHNGAVGGVWARHHSALATFVARRAPHRVVEIGGGTGGLAKRYVEDHAVDRWTVIEPNPAFEAVPPIVVVKAYVEDAGDVVADADAIVHGHVLEHIYEPRAFLATIRAQAPPGATMLVSVPHLAGLLAQSGSNALNFEHTYFFDRDLMVWMLEDAGFSIVAEAPFEQHSLFFEARPDVAPGQAGAPPDARGGAQAFASFVDAARVDAARLTARASTFDGDVYLFGAHVFSQFLIGCGFPAQRARAVLDNDPNKQGQRLYGTPLTVAAPEAMAQRSRDGRATAVIVRATHYSAEITAQLRALAPEVEIW
ncbi:class I SAM-dependent methyltransferase [Baekduia sp. Peel2402]|uniref:class I SAM-dependent methyltransferase n=1 Tax=Baekduia sp. Peel2402 TaxID=3458296 RepID=UPI00403EE241